MVCDDDDDDELKMENYIPSQLEHTTARYRKCKLHQHNNNFVTW